MLNVLGGFKIAHTKKTRCSFLFWRRHAEQENQYEAYPVIICHPPRGSNWLWLDWLRNEVTMVAGIVKSCSANCGVFLIIFLQNYVRNIYIYICLPEKSYLWQKQKAPAAYALESKTIKTSIKWIPLQTNTSKEEKKKACSVRTCLRRKEKTQKQWTSLLNNISKRKEKRLRRTCWPQE